MARFYLVMSFEIKKLIKSFSSKGVIKRVIFRMPIFSQSKKVVLDIQLIWKERYQLFLIGK